MNNEPPLMLDRATHRIDSPPYVDSYAMGCQNRRGYSIAYPTQHILEQAAPKQKALLITWILDQHQQGNFFPLIDPTVWEQVQFRSPMPVYERANRLLRYISLNEVEQETDLGGQGQHHFLECQIWSESVDGGAVRYLLAYLASKGLLEHLAVSRDVGPNDEFRCTITIEGHAHLEKVNTESDPTHAFVAMWFNPDTDGIYQKGISPGIQDAGFTPRRIDRIHDNQDRTIDDAVLAEIRRCRFIVVDLTHEAGQGHRGSVYYEAGFAKGLDKPMILTCSQDLISEAAFDINHYPILTWTKDKPENLREQLKNRIQARIG